MISERRGKPVAVGDVSITPIERVSIAHHVVGGVVLFHASKQPIAPLPDRRDSLPLSIVGVARDPGWLRGQEEPASVFHFSLPSRSREKMNSLSPTAQVVRFVTPLMWCW